MSSYFDNPRLRSRELIRLIPIFLEEISLDLSKLKLALRENDRQQCMDLTHKVKGTANSFGILILASEAESLRKSVTANNFGGAAKKLKGLETLLEELQKEAKNMA